MAYKAIVTRVYTYPHPNADRIQLGKAGGYQVVVGKDVEDGTLGVLFPPDGQLSHEYCLANDLYARHPETGEKMGGFFDKNRRVRSQKFRGEKSEAYFASLASFTALADHLGKIEQVGVINNRGRGVLEEGEELDTFLDHQFCQKYETPATRQAAANRAGQKKRENAYFHKHFDTPQLRKDIGDIPEGALLYFTEKLHGTSQRSGYVVEEREATGWRMKLGMWIAGIPGPHAMREYQHLLGTRNVILGQYKGDSFYGSEDFRYRIHNRIKDKLRKGETVYYEVVGLTAGGPDDPRNLDSSAGFIMPPVRTNALKDTKVKDREDGYFPQWYGETMYYTYGNWEADSPASPRAMGGNAAYVYRITQQNTDGESLDLSWEQVKGRATELGMETVPEIVPEVWGNILKQPIVYRGENPYNRVILGGQVSREGLVSHADGMARGPSTLDPHHIREGVCIRWEKDGKMGILKHKSFEFLVLEGVVKTDESYVDREESS